tara:strand:- start:60 stop:806 length:747 start_codon:yes stop_codon:yes gene_type:complete
MTFFHIYEKLYFFHHRNKKIKGFDLYKRAVIKKKGIEIGGPSRIFKKIIPIYHFALSIDGVNFCKNTLWENNLTNNGEFNYFMGKKGIQFIREATSLDNIVDQRYDFLISSHCLEHIANPLKALIEWNRVVKKNGYLILVLPNKEANFDRNRKFTNFEHILDDYNNKVSETDLTHLEEIITFHDFNLDKKSGSKENFIKRAKNNYKIRGLHHHVFNQTLINKMLDWCGYSVLDFDMDKSNFFTLAVKN